MAARPVAHRGLHGGPGVPENSLAAFRAAAERGYAMELDVRLLADGQVVVFHDPDLRRMAGAEIKVHGLTASDLALYRLSGGHECPPLLQDVLANVTGRDVLYMELKHDARGRSQTGRLENRVCALLAGVPGRFGIISFHPHSIAWLRKTRPEFPRGHIVGASDSLPWPRRLLYEHLVLPLLRPHFLFCRADWLEYGFVRRARARGTPVLAWTVRSPQEAEAIRLKADAVVFEGWLPEIQT